MTINIAAASLKATGSSTTRTFGDRLADVLNVKDFGATGDGVTNDTTAIQSALDLAYGTTGSPHGTASVYSNKAVFFPAGNYIISSALTMRSVRGAHIFGAGRFSTTITNTTTNGNVFTTNGCEYSKFERMALTSSGTGVCFELDWDNTGPTALQSNTFADMYFIAGARGLNIGKTGNMGSETSILNCYFANQTVAGLVTANGNALQQSVIGGNFSNCAIGIWVGSGSVPVIHGVGFQASTDTDISIDWTAGDNYTIHGCRSESVNFLRLHAGACGHIACCTQTNASSGVFVFVEADTVFPGAACVDSCRSLNGKFTGNGDLYIRGNRAPTKAYPNAAYISGFTGTVVQNI